MTEQLHRTAETEKVREYLTVAEFAKRAGVSYQAVYDRIKKDLSVYSTEQNGKKMIDAAALELVGNKQQHSQALDINLNQALEQANSQLYKDLIEQLKAENARLTEDIAEKNRLISTLTEMLKNEQEISRAAVTTTGQAQLLQAINTTTDQSEEPEPTQPNSEESVPLTLRQRLARWLMRGK